MTIRIEAAGLRIAEAPPRRRLLLRGAADDAGFAETVHAALGVALPTRPGTAAEGGTARCLWLDPTAWLAECGDPEAAALERLGAIEVTDARLVLQVDGARARELLAVGTGIDLHPAAFPAGRVAGTLFGRLGATLHRLDAPGGEVVFHLHVDRAAGRWLAGWLQAAVRGLDL
jgi:sarcosine oxidase subunit gamma